MRIPRFMVCQGASDEAVHSTGYFIATDIPVENNQQRRGLLMHSTADKAREFVGNTPGDWHIRCLDAFLLSEFMKDRRNRSQFDCVAVDYTNGDGRQVIQCIDADAVEAILAVWNGEQGEMPSVQSWQVFL